MKRARISRGTTPLISFDLPVGEECVAALAITFQQNGKNILTKRLDECSFDGTRVQTVLSQTETMLFSGSGMIRAQCRWRDKDDLAYRTEIMEAEPGEILLEEVI